MSFWLYNVNDRDPDYKFQILSQVEEVEKENRNKWKKSMTWKRYVRDLEKLLDEFVAENFDLMLTEFESRLKETGEKPHQCLEATCLGFSCRFKRKHQIPDKYDYGTIELGLCRRFKERNKHV